MALAILVNLFTAFTSADGAAITAGDRIMLARPSATVFDLPGSGRGNSSKCTAQILHVLEVRGDWIRVSEGWLDGASIVRMDGAVEHFTREIERSPSAFAYAGRSMARWLEHHGPGARSTNRDCLADAEAAIAADPLYALGYCARGALNRRLEQPSAALADFERALRLDPQSARVFWERSRLYFDQMKFDLAMRDIDEAVRLNPLNPAFLAARALVFHMIKDYDHAILDLEEASRLDPFLQLSDTLARSLCRRASRRGLDFAKDIPAAIADLDRAEQLCPRLANEVVMTRGVYNLHVGDARRALADFRRAVEISPESPETHRCLADALACTSDGHGALREFDAAIRLGDLHAETFQERGRLRASLGDFNGALADLEHAIDIDPACFGALADRASLLYEMNDLDAALKGCDAALELGQLAARETRARILLSRKSYAEAASDAAAALVVCGESADTYELRGLAFASIGHHDVAVHDLSCAIKLAEERGPPDATSRPVCSVPHLYASVFRRPLTADALAELYRARANSLDALGRAGDAEKDRQHAAELNHKDD